MEQIPLLRGLVDACIYIFRNLSVIGPTDSQLADINRVLGFIARNCNDLYVSKCGDIFNPPSDK